VGRFCQWAGGSAAVRACARAGDSGLVNDRDLGYLFVDIGRRGPGKPSRGVGGRTTRRTDGRGARHGTTEEREIGSKLVL
jgi:hypothetical protein